MDTTVTNNPNGMTQNIFGNQRDPSQSVNSVADASIGDERFASQFPEWDLLPPDMPIRRARLNV